MNHIQQWFQFFEQVSCFYRQMFMLPLWNKYPNYMTDIWDSLSIFLEGYAFERQGRRPDYFPAAVDALQSFKHKKNNNFTKSIKKNIWQRFRKSLNNKGLNPKNNPLYPSTNPNKLKGIGKKHSIIEIVIQKNIVGVGQKLTFTSYLGHQIETTKNIQNVFNLITKIRGIGSKVASFYLRDLVDIIGINLSDVQNRQLLQPVDIWVERTVRILSNNNQLNKEAVANWIVTESLKNNVNPEHVNMGIWFFCSQIITSEYKLNRTLVNFNIAQNLLYDYRNRIRNVCKIC